MKELLHFLMCYFLADTTYNFLPHFIGKDEYWQPIIPLLIAIGVSFMFGIGKEVWDKYHDKETFSAGDLTMDAVGALTWLFVAKVGEILPWA